MAAKLRDAIQDSFLKLVLQKPADRITVKEIVNDCGINRNSFYYYLEDLPDLIEKVVEERILNISDISRLDSFHDLIMELTAILLRNQTLIRNINNSKSRVLMEMKLSMICQKLVKSYMENSLFRQYRMSEQDQKVIVSCYQDQVAGFLIEWLNSNVSYDPRPRIERIFYLRGGAMEQMAERAAREYSEKLKSGLKHPVRQPGQDSGKR